MTTLRYRLARLRANPLPAISVTGMLVLAYVILGPVLSVVRAAFLVQAVEPGLTALPGASTLFYVKRIFASSRSDTLFYQPLLHSVELAALGTALTILIGASAGWLVARTDVWGVTRWLGVMLVAYMIPSWAFAQAWLSVFRTRSGSGFPGMLESAHLTPPTWLAYGLFPSALVLALHLCPLVMTLTADAFARIDGATEESARLLGASRTTILVRILLPSIRPALLSATLLVAAHLIGDFGVPWYLGADTHWSVLGTSLYSQVRGGYWGTTSVIATVIIGLGIVMVFGDTLLARGTRRFESMRGSTSRAETTRLGAARPVAFAYLAVLALVSFVGPVIVLAGSSLMARQANPSLTDLSLKYWIGHTGNTYYPVGLLRMEQFWHSLLNTVWVAAVAAVLCALVGLVVAILVKNSGGLIGGALRQISFLPQLLPGIALGAGMIDLFIVRRGPLPALYGTMALVVLAMVVSHLPYSSRIGIAAISQVGGELEEAGRVCGAGWFSTLTRVTVPLLARSFGAAMVFPFISFMKELTLVVLLMTGSTSLLPMLSSDIKENGLNQAANGVTLVITVLAVAGGLVARKVGKGGADAALAA